MPELHRGERHPQRRNPYGSPKPGSSSKKGGDGGKGNWGRIGHYDGMPGGALDQRDPNYSSDDSASSSPPMESAAPIIGPPVAQHPRAIVQQHQQQQYQQQQAVLRHTSSEPQFKRVPLEQLFAAAAAGATNPSSPSKDASDASASTGGKKSKKNKKNSQQTVRSSLFILLCESYSSFFCCSKRRVRRLSNTQAVRTTIFLVPKRFRSRRS